jgi:hypothetical protein
VASIIYNEQAVRAIMNQKIHYARLSFGSRLVAGDLIFLHMEMIEVFKDTSKTLNLPFYPEIVILPAQKKHSSLSISVSMSRWPDRVDSVLKVRGKSFRIWDMLINQGDVVGIR